MSSSTKKKNNKPTIVCLCGSTSFHTWFEQVNLEETLAGRIVLSIGANTKDSSLNLTGEDKERLDALHKHKIDLADEVLIITPNGYIGESTSSEIAHALRKGKQFRWLGPAALFADWHFCAAHTAAMGICDVKGCAELAQWWNQETDRSRCDWHAFVRKASSGDQGESGVAA